MTPELQYSDGGNPKLDPLVREGGNDDKTRCDFIASIHQSSLSSTTKA